MFWDWRYYYFTELVVVNLIQGYLLHGHPLRTIGVVCVNAVVLIVDGCGSRLWWN